jgi:hypothetical protein
MLQVIGSPTEADLGFVTSDKARRYLRTLPKMPRSDWRQRYPQVRGCQGVLTQGLGCQTEGALGGHVTLQCCVGHLGLCQRSGYALLTLVGTTRKFSCIKTV